MRLKEWGLGLVFLVALTAVFVLVSPVCRRAGAHAWGKQKAEYSPVKYYYGLTHTSYAERQEWYFGWLVSRRMQEEWLRQVETESRFR